MGLGEVYPSEGRTFTDGETGARIRQLTDYLGHSHHLYFTNSGLWDQGRRLVMISHRNNAQNFFSIELSTGDITQLTDLPARPRVRMQSSFLNPVRDEAYFVREGDVWAVDLKTYQQRKLYSVPDGFFGGNLSCSADGKTICHVVREDLSKRIHMDLGHGYVGFAEYSAARPHSKIVAIDVDGGQSRVLHEEDFWLGHINTSPAIADVLTFCHEGPWDTIAQRMWTLNLSTGKVAALRPQVPGEAIGHEYWFSDGRRLGYHGRKNGVHLFGHINCDGTDQVEYDFPHGSYHFHSIDENLIVGDGMPDDPYMLLWRLENGKYEGPRKLLKHRGSFHVQHLHVHPRMFTDRDRAIRITYSADPQSYGNVYIVDAGDFDSLPQA